MWYLRLVDSNALKVRVKHASKELRRADGSCSRRGREPAVKGYRDGVRVCYNQGGLSWVEWSDDEALIYAYARREPSNLFRLFSWWHQNVGPS